MLRGPKSKSQTCNLGQNSKIITSNDNKEIFIAALGAPGFILEWTNQMDRATDRKKIQMH